MEISVVDEYTFCAPDQPLVEVAQITIRELLEQLKYTSDGDVVLQRPVFLNIDGGVTNPSNFSVDSAGNLFTVHGSGSNTLPRIFIRVVYYEADGRIVWTKTADLRNRFLKGLRGASSDSDGNVIFAGMSQKPYPGLENEIWIAKLTSDGESIFLKFFDAASLGSHYIDIMGVTADNAGNIILAGSASASSGGPSEGPCWGS